MEQTAEGRKHRAPGRAKRYVAQRRLGWMISIALAGLMVWFVFFVWLTPMAVTGDSMAPALREGEVVLADRLAKYWKTPARGDMIVFTTQDGMFIKRIVGLAGETVEIVDGQVFLDSRPLDESGYAVNFVGSLAQVTVPDGAVFVLGDNREKMYDSRLETVGCIALEQIVGVMRLRVAPISRVTVFF